MSGEIDSGYVTFIAIDSTSEIGCEIGDGSPLVGDMNADTIQKGKSGWRWNLWKGLCFA